ncbi:MAG: LuxR C-terminal-related transcriptional regulator [Gordonibacter sp.]
MRQRAVLASALLLSNGSNLKYGWGTVRPGDGSLAAGDLAGVVKFVATEREVTQRESEVMLLLSEGKTRRAICEELSVSPDTVKTHVRSIYRKLAVHSQQELVEYLAREREELAADGSEHALEERGQAGKCRLPQA